MTIKTEIDGGIRIAAKSKDCEVTPKDRYRLRDLLWGRKGHVAVLALASTAGGFVEAGFLILVTRAGFALAAGHSTIAIGGGVETTITVLAGAAVLLVILRLALNMASTWLSARLATEVVASLRRRLASAYLSASWASQHGERGGRFQELLTTFANRGSDLVLAVTQAIIAGCSLAALLVIAVAVDPLSSTAVIGAVGLLAMALRPLRIASRRQAESTVDAGMQFATALDEISQLGMEMHVFNIQTVLRDRVNLLIDSNEHVNFKLNFLRGMVPAAYSSLAYLALVGALGVGSLLNSANFEAVGAVMLVMLRSLTYGQAFQAQLAGVYSTLPFTDALNDEVTRFQRAAQLDGGEAVGSVGALRLASVSFEYTPETPVLSGIDLEIQLGEVIGIVGPSGSGKSTLVQLLLGLRHPTTGRALAHGQEIGRFARKDWARKVALVPQHAHLIAGSISDNIRFMRAGIDQAEIERAAHMAHIHDEIMGFTEGYERQVGERGSRLSGGQQQRMIIARALAGNPEVLILDEPTSSLDVRSESLVRQTLDGLRDRVTVIIIAHRLSTLEICDRIMVVQDGQLVGFDSPAALEQSSSFYRESLRLSGLR